MKNILQGIMKTKARTIFNIVIVVLVAMVTSVTIAMMSGGMNKGNPPDNAGLNQGAQQTTVATQNNNENSQNSQTDQGQSNNNQMQKPDGIMNDRPSNGNTTAFIIFGIALALGAVLLIVVNASSTKGRKKEILTAVASGESFKKIKSRFFVEAVLTVAIAAIIGTAVGTFTATPISSALTGRGNSGFSQNGGTPPNNSNSDSSAPPQLPSNSDNNGQQQNQSGDNSSNSPSSNNNTSAEIDSKGSFSEDGGKQSNTDYLTIALSSIGVCAILAIIAGLSSTCNIKRISNGEDEDDEDDEEKNDE